MTEIRRTSSAALAGASRPSGAGGTGSGMVTLTETRWFDVCDYDDLLPECGECALVEGRQVAIFRTHDGRLFALSNRDPFSGAYVLARGIVGSRGGLPTVASPMYKQVFDLVTGCCLDDSSVSVPTFRIRLTGTRVEVGQP